jgi:type I restriction enzyme S subunit
LRQPRMVDYASSKTTGANLPRLSPKALAEFEIPLPPLSEQKRIADILDKADSIRRKRQETVTVAEGFVSALFMEMFASHHSAHSDTVKVMSFDDAISDFIDYRGKTPCKSTSGVPLVTAKVVKGGRILPPDEFIPDGDYDAWMRRGLPLRGDVLFTTEAPLGEVAQVADERIALAQRVLLMRGKKSVLNNTFLRLAIKTPFVWNQIQRRSTGSTVRGIRQKELRQVTLPVPSIAEQEQFERIAQRQEQSIEVLRTSATHAELLFNSLVQCAFKGEL